MVQADLAYARLDPRPPRRPYLQDLVADAGTLSAALAPLADLPPTPRQAAGLITDQDLRTDATGARPSRSRSPKTGSSPWWTRQGKTGARQ